MLFSFFFAGKRLQQALLNLECPPAGAPVILSPAYDRSEAPTPNRLFRQILGSFTVRAAKGRHPSQLLSDDVMRKLNETTSSWCAPRSRDQEESKLKNTVEEEPALNDGEPPAAEEIPHPCEVFQVIRAFYNNFKVEPNSVFKSDEEMASLKAAFNFEKASKYFQNNSLSLVKKILELERFVLEHVVLQIWLLMTHPVKTFIEPEVALAIAAWS